MTPPMTSSQLVDRAREAGYVLTDAGRQALPGFTPEALAELTQALAQGATPDQISTDEWDGEPCFASITDATSSFDALYRPTHGCARFDDGLLTVGTYADDTPARWPLWAAGRARHTTIVGAQAGTTTLLRSILLGARDADVDAQVIDVYDASLRMLGYPTATSLAAAETALAGQHDLIRARHRSGDLALRLLVINDLHLFEQHLYRLLAPVVRYAAQAGIAIVAGTRQLTLGAFGSTTSAEPTRAELTRELVLLHTEENTTPALADAAELPPIPARFGDGSPTAGIGYLPGRGTQPFRAWLP